MTLELSDRLQRALRVSGVTREEMMAYLEVKRNTIGSWLSGRVPPSPATIRLWSILTKVPYEWLRDGEWPDAATPDGS